MPGRTESFNQRIVKVVIPTLEGKTEWAQAAARDGFPENVSGWVRTVVAKHLGEESKRLASQAAEAQTLSRRVKELESDLQLMRDAYEKVRGDFAGLSKRYEELAQKHSVWLAAEEARKAEKLVKGWGPGGRMSDAELSRPTKGPQSPTPEHERAGSKPRTSKDQVEAESDTKGGFKRRPWRS